MAMGAISMIVGVVLLILLKVLVEDEGRGDQIKFFHGIDHDELFKEDLEYDPSWSILSSNTHHEKDE